MKLIVNPSRLSDCLKEGFKEVTRRADAFRHQAIKCSIELQDEAVQLNYWSLHNQGITRQQLDHINQKLTPMEFYKLFDPVFQAITEKGEYNFAL